MFRKLVLATAVAMAAILPWTTSYVKAEEPQACTQATLTRFFHVGLHFYPNGARVTYVAPDSPLRDMESPDGHTKAAIDVGDRIVRVDSHPIHSACDYTRAMNGADDPDRIKIVVWDKDSHFNYTWYAGSLPYP